jgi:hypothetical protein
MREADVPGRKPSVPEKAGVGEDYIITNVKMVKGSAPRAAAAKPGDTPTGTSGASMMYRVEGVSADMLKSNVNKRVQLDGTFTDLDRAAAPASGSSDLVDIKATTIRAVPGECPAK